MAKPEASTINDSPAVQAVQALLAATGAIPGIHWIHGDSVCDCTHQIIGEWTNPYLAETQRIRICCAIEVFFKDHPNLIQRIPAFFDVGRFQYVTEPMEWDATEMDMPVELWFRQLAKQHHQSLGWVRSHYGDRLDERPKRVKERVDRTPTAAERTLAQEKELKAAGWLLPDETWEGK